MYIFFYTKAFQTLFLYYKYDCYAHLNLEEKCIFSIHSCYKIIFKKCLYLSLITPYYNLYII